MGDTVQVGDHVGGYFEPFQLLLGDRIRHGVESAGDVLIASHVQARVLPAAGVRPATQRTTDATLSELAQVRKLFP